MFYYMLTLFLIILFIIFFIMIGQYAWIFYMLLSLSVVFTIIMLPNFISMMIEKHRRKILKEQYNVDFIPKGFKIIKNKTNIDGEYQLNFPGWLYSNKDGSMNKVRVGNKLMYYYSNLYYKEFQISTTNPLAMVKLVHEFRTRFGIDVIKKNEQELIKYNYLTEKNTLLQKSNTIQSIIDECKDEPTKFEGFCGILFEKMGYEVEVTPKTNDGGYDLILNKDNEKSIVECKCYALSNSVGRPLLQKLVGANQGYMADRMLFVTTSTFTQGAIKYSKDVDVELIDGEKLISLCKEYINRDIKKLEEVTAEEWELNEYDISCLYPPDYSLYF